MNRLLLKLFLCVSVLFAVWSAFSFGTGAEAEDLSPAPPRFQKVLVLFSADMAKADRDAFLAGLEQERLRHRKDYSETVRKWRESAPAEPERKQVEQGKAIEAATGDGLPSRHDLERTFSHNPYFLDVVDVQMIRTDLANPSFEADPGAASFPLRDMESLRGRFGSDEAGRGEALIVVASDEIAAAVNHMIRNGFFESCRDDMVILFAGVSSFDGSVRNPRKNGNAIEPAKAPYVFAILHPVDPWPNTELALSVFPNTKKIILLTSGKLWNKEREDAYLSKLGLGTVLKPILIPEVPKQDVTEEDIKALKDKFATDLKAEIAPDTIVVTLSSVGQGVDPASWLPDDFDACPVFTDTNPVRTSSVGGFGPSMTNLGVQSAEILEQLGSDSLLTNKFPPIVMEEAELRLNTTALRKFGLKKSSFPENSVMTDSESGRVLPPNTLSWAQRHFTFVHSVCAAVIVVLFAFILLSVRAGRRKRHLAELIYGALPVRVLVMDRDGRIIAHHDQYGELEQKGEFLWKNIGEVPWLQGTGAIKLVHDVFDSGKTVVREMEIDGERRAVVLARTPSDVFGRPAVIAVSSVSPEEKKA